MARACFGEERSLGDSIRVWAHGIQHDDGRIGDGATEAPGISVDGRSWEEGISNETARRLADLLGHRPGSLTSGGE